jgi:hypothetical protein
MCVYGSMTVMICNVLCVCMYVDTDVCMYVCMGSHITLVQILIILIVFGVLIEEVFHRDDGTVRLRRRGRSRQEHATHY